MTVHARTTRTAVDTAGDQLRNMIADLTRTRSHRERLTATIGHTTVAHSHFTRVPPLLAQLRYADWTKGDDRSGTSFESRPAASIEALDTLVCIDLEAARWVRDLGEDDPPTTIGCVALLGGLLPSAHRCKARHGREQGSGWCCTWHAVEHDVRRWWTQARIVTGWELPAWRPDNTCPGVKTDGEVCGARRSLRIRLAERIGFCVECRSTWLPTDYQSLADHIRTESEARGRAPVRGPCVCAWPRGVVTGLAALCPKCGSASCEHAVRSTGRKSTT